MAKVLLYTITKLLLHLLQDEVVTQRFVVGDPVRIDIPDTTDPDHARLHGRTGTVVAVLKDDAGTETGDKRDNLLYRVEVDDANTEDLRWRDLRPE